METTVDNDVELLINTLLEKQIQSLKEGIEWLENLKPRKQKKVKRGPYKKKTAKGWSPARRKKFSAFMKKKWEAEGRKGFGLK